MYLAKVLLHLPLSDHLSRGHLLDHPLLHLLQLVRLHSLHLPCDTATVKQAKAIYSTIIMDYELAEIFFWCKVDCVILHFDQ